MGIDDKNHLHMTQPPCHAGNRLENKFKFTGPVVDDAQALGRGRIV